MSQGMDRGGSRIAWTLGAWCLEPAGQDAGRDLVVARLKGRARRAQRQEAVMADTPLPMAEGVDWRGGVLDVVRLGANAPNWGFFECTDLNREFLEFSSGLPQAGFLVAAWHQDLTAAKFEMRAAIVRGGYSIWLPGENKALEQAPGIDGRERAMSFVAEKARAMLESRPKELAWLAGLAAARLDAALPERGHGLGLKAPGRL